MWPSAQTAAHIYNYCNAALIGSLLVGVAATFGIVRMGDVKEEYLRRDLATAARDAAQANERAASAELELERLKTPRTLSPRSAAELVAEASAYRGQRVSVGAVTATAEGATLEQQLATAFKAAGMIAEVNRGAADFQIGNVRGVLIATVAGNAKAERFATTLTQFLNANGISAVWKTGLREVGAEQRDRTEPGWRQKDGNEWALVVVGDK